MMKKNAEAHLKIWLLEGRSITHNQAQQMWGTNRLAVFIGRLKAKGMNIEMKMTTENGNRFGVYKMVSVPKIDRIKTRQYLEQV